VLCPKVFIGKKSKILSKYNPGKVLKATFVKKLKFRISIFHTTANN
jgi:hypothetical protein